ncbi:unnamed protein product [Effrenium voratum]|nr:unnamed protein product [Effrenium voratum]
MANVPRCGDCSRPLEPEVAACGRQLCVRCAGPVRAKAALAAAPEAEEVSGSSSSEVSPEPEASSEPPRKKATLVPRKEEPEPGKPNRGRPTLQKRKSFEEKAEEAASRLQAKLDKFKKEQEQKMIQKEKKEKKSEKEPKLKGKKKSKKCSSE